MKRMRSLCARGAPHSGTLAAIEHTELDGGAVGDKPHAPPGIDLADDLSLGITAHSGVAAHLPDLVHVGRDEERIRAERAAAAATPHGQHKPAPMTMMS